MLALALAAGTASAQQRTPTSGGNIPVADTLRLTRRQAIATALLANPQLEIAREQTSQVRAQRVEGIAIPDPTLSGSLDSLTRFRSIGSAPSRPLSLGLVVPFPDKFRLRNSIGMEGIHASEAQYQLLAQQITSQAGRSYDSVLVTRMHRRDLTEARTLAADFLVRTQARFNAGTVPRLDVINAQVSLAQADNDLIGNSRDVVNAEAALNRVIGRALGLPILPADSLAAPGPLPELLTVEETALRSRPEITGLEAQIRGARANTALTKELAFTPDITFGASRDFGDDAWYANTVYSLGLTMPVPVFFWQHTKGDFAETHHRELELAATYRDTRASVAQDVRVSFAAADAALRQVIFIRDQLLPSAREAYRVATTSYALGGLSALDVLSARTALLAAESQYADALAAANSARSDLERAAGVPLTTFAPGANREQAFVRGVINRACRRSRPGRGLFGYAGRQRRVRCKRTGRRQADVFQGHRRAAGAPDDRDGRRASSFRPTLEVTGTVAFNGDKSTQVMAPISGPVSRIIVSLGTTVAAGEPLATVASPDFAAAVAGYRKSDEAARNTQRILKLDGQLFQNDALARSDLDQARTDAASAAADLEAAVLQLRSLGVEDSVITAIHEGKQTAPVESVIRSPIPGTLVERLISPGQLIQAGTTAAFTVAELSSMWVFASVYSTDIGLVSAGETAQIVTEGSEKPVAAHVDYVAPIVDPGTKATSVRLVADNPGQILKRDMFVRVLIRSTQEHHGILVPSAAILHDEDNLPFVFVAKSDGTFDRHRITVGYRVDDRYEVLTGNTAGDKVVANGALFIQFAESQ